MPTDLGSGGSARDCQDLAEAGWDLGRARLVLAAFASTLLMLVLVLVAGGHGLQSIPMFGPEGRTAYRDRIDLLGVGDIVATKAAHALRTRPYDVGLFGNSRSIEVASADIGLPAGAYFNYSVGGASFLQSAALLEYLADRGKAPKLAVISIDNYDIEFTGSVYWPPSSLLLKRFDESLADGGTGQTPGQLARTSIRLALDAWTDVRERLRGFFNGARAEQLVRFFGGVSQHAADSPERYAADGARSRRIDTDSTDLKIFPGALSVEYAKLVETDLGRLAKLQAGGLRIVIYESPTHPALRNQMDARRTDAVRMFRGGFFAACRRNGLTCLPAPDLRGSLPWADCCHPPPALLGRFIGGLL